MNCPSCGSENCQRYEVIYAYGTSSTSSAGVGAGIGTRGPGLGIGIGRGTQRSQMAIKTAPPRRHSTRRARWLLAACSIFTMMLVSLHSAVAWFFVAVGLLAGLRIYRAASYNSKKWPQYFEEWKRQWFCNQCGETFERASVTENEKLS